VPRHVADYYDELSAVVRRGGSGRSVARRSRPADGRTVLLPLVTQGRRPRGHHTERGRLPHGYRLIGRLGGDRGCRRGWIYRERGGVAGHASCGVPYHHNERRPIVRRGFPARRSSDLSRPADGRTVLLPLVTQGRRARGHHTERGRLPHCYRLIGWLGRDRGCRCCCIHRERGCVTGYVPRHVADYHNELCTIVRGRKRGGDGGSGGVRGG